MRKQSIPRFEMAPFPYFWENAVEKEDDEFEGKQNKKKVKDASVTDVSVPYTVYP